MAAILANKLSEFAYTVEMRAKKGNMHLVPVVAIAADLEADVLPDIFEMAQEQRSNACFRLYCKLVENYSWKDVAAFLHFCIQLAKGKTGPQDMLAFLTNCRDNPVAFGFIGSCAVEQAIFGSTKTDVLDGNLQFLILDNKYTGTGNPQYGAVCGGTCKNDKFAKMRWPNNGCKVCRNAKLPPAFNEPVTLLKVPVVPAKAAGKNPSPVEKFRIAEWGDDAEEQPEEEKPKEDKPEEDKPEEGKPKEDKPKEDKQKEDKPKEDKPKEDKQAGVVGVSLVPSDEASPAPPQRTFAGALGHKALNKAPNKAPSKAWPKACRQNEPVQRLGFPPLPVGRAVPDVQKAQLQDALLAEQEKARQLQVQKDASDKLLQEARQLAEQQEQRVAQLRQELEMAHLRQELQDAKLEKERLKLENERLRQSHADIGERAFVQGTPTAFTVGKFLRGSAAVEHFSC